MPEMSETMRPMNESTISSVEISIEHTCCAFFWMAFDRSSCNRSASWSCMSTWMVTSRNSPIRRMGMRLHQTVSTRAAHALERQGKRVGEIGLGGDALEIHPEVDNRLRDLRAHARDDAFRAHEAAARSRS